MKNISRQTAVSQNPDNRSGFQGGPGFGGRLPLFLLLLGSVLGTAITGCQDAVEPSDDLSVPVAVTVQVENQDGTGIAGANVRLSRIGEFGQSARTVANGSVRYENIQVPLVGETYEVTIDLPPPAERAYINARRILPGFRENLELTGTTIRDTVFLPCRDVNVLYRVRSRADFICNSTRSNRFEIDFCLEDRTLDTLCTPELLHTCPGDIDFNLPDPGIAGLSLVGFDGAGNSLGTSFSIPPNTPFAICAIFTATGPQSLPSQQVAVTGTGAGTLQQRIEIGLLVDSCIDCDCPEEIDPIDVRDSACVGVASVTDIDLSDIVNTGDEECVWRFEVESGFTSPALQVVRAPEPVAGGSQGDEMSIRFAPTTPGTVVDSIVFAVYRGQGESVITGGSGCGERLVVRFNGLAGTFGCRIDTAASTLFRNGLLDPMLTCVGIPTTRTLVIKNDGPCPLDLSGLVTNLSGANVFSLSPSNLSVGPNDSGTFRVTFLPTNGTVWPGGRGNGPGRTGYQGELRIQGDCGLQTYLLNGTADTLCRGSRVQIMHQWGSNNGQWYEGIIINEQNNSIQYENDNVAQGGNITGNRDLWIESINIPGTSARICTDNASWQVVGNRQPTVAGQTACDIANFYLSQCGSGSPGCLDVDLWDVIVFTLPGGQCGILWITNIANDAPTLGTPAVTVQLCYPL